MRFINEGIDHHLTNWDKGPAQAAGYYAGDKSYDDPSISPIYGDFNGFPPTYLISGTRDLMLSDTVRTHRKLRQAGVEADLHVYEGIAHADYILLINTPESQEHYRELNAFLSLHPWGLGNTLRGHSGTLAQARVFAPGFPSCGDLRPSSDHVHVQRDDHVPISAYAAWRWVSETGCGGCSRRQRRSTAPRRRPTP
jgi:hypothetical protein